MWKMSQLLRVIFKFLHGIELIKPNLYFICDAFNGDTQHKEESWNMLLDFEMTSLYCTPLRCTRMRSHQVSACLGKKVMMKTGKEIFS